MAASAPEAGAPAQPRAPFARRALEALPLAGLALVVLVFYFVEAALQKTPWDFTDELEWSQLSRAIAATGHAARRGQPIFFKSLYSYLIAPAWWLHSTQSAYDAIKDLDAVVMCLTAVPVYLLARMLCSRRAALCVAAGSIAIPAMSYATSIIPEPLAYFWFGLAAWLAVRALTKRTPASAVLALAVAAVGPLIRKEFVALPAIALLAAAALWALEGASGASLRPRLRRIVLALVGLAVFGLVFNWLVVERVNRWSPSQYVNRHTLGDGGLAAGALAIGLGMLPVIGGLASLALPERRGERAYRGFCAYLAAAVAVLWLYTALKVTYLAGSTTPIEERNLFFLSPLLLLGTALVCAARRLDWRAVAAATALALYVVWSADASELGAPWFDAPGLAVLALVNRDFRWDANDFRILLCAVAAVSVVLLALRARRGVALLTVVLVGAWLLTGEIYETSANIDEANGFAAMLPAPRNWVDRASRGAPVTFLGQAITNADTLWLTEFWNRSLHHVASLDGSAPGPGPATAPALDSSDGTLGGYTGDPYTLAGPGVVLAEPVVAQRTLDNGVYTLYRTPRSWRLRQSEEGVDSDGWAGELSLYTFFVPGGPGVLTVDLSRTAYDGPGPPGAVTIRLGTVKLDVHGEPALARTTATVRRAVPNGGRVVVRIPVAATPLTVEVSVAPGTLISVPGDTRRLGVQPAFFFARDPGGR